MNWVYFVVVSFNQVSVDQLGQALRDLFVVKKQWINQCAAHHVPLPKNLCASQRVFFFLFWGAGGSWYQTYLNLCAMLGSLLWAMRQVNIKVVDRSCSVKCFHFVSMTWLDVLICRVVRIVQFALDPSLHSSECKNVSHTHAGTLTSSASQSDISFVATSPPWWPSALSQDTRATVFSEWLILFNKTFGVLVWILPDSPHALCCNWDKKGGIGRQDSFTYAQLLRNGHLTCFNCCYSLHFAQSLTSNASEMLMFADAITLCVCMRGYDEKQKNMSNVEYSPCFCIKWFWKVNWSSSQQQPNAICFNYNNGCQPFSRPEPDVNSKFLQITDALLIDSNCLS